MAAAAAASAAIRINPFAFRQFDDPSYAGTKLSVPKAEFAQRVNEHYRRHGAASLRAGYAPFCKHLFIPNWMDSVRCGDVEITEQNRHLLRCGYVARQANELPVLSRWFLASEVSVPRAAWLDVILYSRAQIEHEDAAMGRTPDVDNDYEWGVVAVKGQDVDYELPMSPATMLRNALGKAEGGSGVPLDRDAYMRSVEYWDKRAIVQ